MNPMPSLLTLIGQRPTTHIRVRTADGRLFDLGRQVDGHDLVSRWFRWRQKRKIAAYIRARRNEMTHG